MTFHVISEFLFVLERSSAQVAGVGLVLGVGPPDVAVVGGVRSEGLPAVLALEGPLSGVLADVSAQNAGSSEGLDEREAEFKWLWCFIHSNKQLRFYFQFDHCQTKKRIIFIHNEFYFKIL